MTRRTQDFAKEADLVAGFCAYLADSRVGEGWVPYHETAGFDLLLVHADGRQIGIEAKLSLNLEVLAQAMPSGWEAGFTGPDYRAVLVPRGGAKYGELATRLGVTVLRFYDCVYRPEVGEATPGYVHRPSWHLQPGLPTKHGESEYLGTDWWDWCPAKRCALPDYVPDVQGGKPAPVALTPWKVKAIKLMILLDRRGRVTRGDMKALQLSPTRFTDRFNGFLSPDGRGGYVRCDATPDFRAQHPRNYGEIDADFEKWCPPGYRFEAEAAA